MRDIACFGVAPGEGNLARVFEEDRSGDRSDEAGRQALAREAGVNACVFIDRGPDGGAVLDYYYPHARSPLCLHATLAAARVLLAGHGQMRVTTAMRGQSLVLSSTVDGLFIKLEPQQVPDVVPDPALLNTFFDDAPAWVSPPAVVSVGSPKLLLQVADRAALEALAPKLETIVAWGREHGVSGCYAWCELEDGTLAGRNFNHLDPALEDSATGVAAGALALHLGRDVGVSQGANVGRPCLIQARLHHGAVRVGGRAEALS